MHVIALARSQSRLDFERVQEFWADIDLHVDLCDRAAAMRLNEHPMVDVWILHSHLGITMMNISVYEEIKRRFDLFPNDSELRNIFKQSKDRIFKVSCAIAMECNNRQGDFGACKSSLALIMEKLVLALLDEPHSMIDNDSSQFKWSLKTKVYNIMR